MSFTLNSTFTVPFANIFPSTIFTFLNSGLFSSVIITSGLSKSAFTTYVYALSALEFPALSIVSIIIVYSPDLSGTNSNVPLTFSTTLLSKSKLPFCVGIISFLTSSLPFLYCTYILYEDIPASVSSIE